MPPEVLRVYPKFLVRDVAASLRHYEEFLGFTIASVTGAPPVFGIVERNGFGIHFKRGEPRTRRAADEAWDAYFEVRGVDALHTELVRAGANISRGLQTMPYGMKELDVCDPDGYVVCFAEATA